MAIRAVIFDFDGIILDTETPDYTAWQETFQDHGSHLSLDVWAQAVGVRSNTFDPLSFLEAKIGQSLDRAAVDAARRKRFHAMVDALALLPGIEDYVTKAKVEGLHLGLASSADRDWVHSHLKNHGLFEAFDIIRTADDVLNTKPAPDLYLEVIDALNVNAHEAIAIEDSPHGVAAARAAGLYCIAIPNPITRHYDLSQAHLRLNSLADMPLELLLRWVSEFEDESERAT